MSQGNIQEKIKDLYEKLDELAKRSPPSTPSDVGLSHVPNMPKASLNEAREGKSNTGIMTPLMTHEAISAQVTDVDMVNDLIDAIYTALEDGKAKIEAAIESNG